LLLLLLLGKLIFQFPGEIRVHTNNDSCGVSERRKETLDHEDLIFNDDA